MKDNIKNLRVSSTFILRSKANNGDLSKQICIILGKEGTETSLAVKRYSLTKNPKIYKTLGFKVLKKYKNYYLVVQLISIQLKSLNEILEWMNSINKEK